MDLIAAQHKDILDVREEEEKLSLWVPSIMLPEYLLLKDIFQGWKPRGQAEVRNGPTKTTEMQSSISPGEPLKKELGIVQRRGITTPTEMSTELISSLAALRKPPGKMEI